MEIVKEYKIEVLLPKEYIEPILKAVSVLGACKVGNYDHVATFYEIEGCWKPGSESSPVTGVKNEVNYGKEYKLEFRCEESKVKDVVSEINRIHPYDEVLINVIELVNYKFD